MRFLVWLTLGFGAACGIGVYFFLENLYLPMAAAGAGCLVMALLGVRRPRLRPAALMLLGLTLGLGWYLGYQSIRIAPLSVLDGQVTQASIRAVDYSTATDYGSAVDGILKFHSREYQVRVYLDGETQISPGTLLSGSFRFRVTAPSSREDSTYFGGSGIFLLTYQQDALEMMPAGDLTFRERAAALRRSIRDALETCLPGDAAPFAKALLLGDTSGLDYKTDTDLKISGIRHVAVVSGLHISIFIALLTAVTMKKRLLRVSLGLPLLLLFAAVAGFTPSVTRACIMCALMLLALLLERDYDGPTALSFAALVMLLWNPMTIASVSFQLSVASVAGIFLFEPPVRQWIRDVLTIKGHLPPDWLTGSISLTLSAQALTTPLCAWYFGTVSLIGIVTNLLCLWAVNFAFFCLIALCILFCFWKSTAILFGNVAALPIRYVLAVSGFLADLPLAAVYTESDFITAWLIFLYLLLAVFLLGKPRKPHVLIACAAVGLCTALIASWAEPRRYDTRITLLDVGQGQCILLQSGGRNFLVDCGGDSDTRCADLAASTLLSQGISRLDGLILTHYDRDHAGGAENLLSRVDTGLLILPPEKNDIVRSTGGQVLYAAEAMELAFGDAILWIYPAQYPGTSNEKSICVLFDTEKCDILITGDRNAFGEALLLREYQIPEVDILVAGHHGSKHSTSEALLDAVKPEIVCVSAGNGNPFGHPTPELLERLDSYGCAIYRTDKHGTITIRR